jgi:hypothetical protein
MQILGQHPEWRQDRFLHILTNLSSIIRLKTIYELNKYLLVGYFTVLSVSRLYTIEW